MYFSACCCTALITSGCECPILATLNPEIRSSIIYYDALTYKIRKAEIEWWKKAMIYENENMNKKTWLTVMEYTYPVSPGISVAETVNKIIVLKNGTAEATAAYKDYRLHVSF